jgi:hypothetical protein
MAMSEREELVLCGASAYNQKYYLNDAFRGLPDQVKDELRILCVVFVEDVGGIIELVFNEAGSLSIRTSSEGNDFLYDEIGCDLKIKEMQQKNRELFAQLELYYKVLYS